MKSDRLESRGPLRRCLLLLCRVAAAIAILAGASASLWGSAARAQTTAFRTTVEYVVQFYPLWFTRLQSMASSDNHLVGPDRISHVYQAVVAINDDTLYANTILSLKAEPVIVTIPRTSTTYSILNLDLYGNVFDAGIPSATPGRYGLVGPDFTGQLPTGITGIQMPLNTSVIIFRADKFSSTGESRIVEAEVLRRHLKMQTLSNYEEDPSGGNALIVPEIFFGTPFKTIADELIRLNPLLFLEQLQLAVGQNDIASLGPEAQALSDRFNRLFARKDIDREQFADGARMAHQSILSNYLNNTGPTNWITFNNIGAWGDDVLDRASITEFIQYGNGRATAAYYHAFTDDRGEPLVGGSAGDAGPRDYVLSFLKREIPEAGRFWSVTAYTPNSIELVENSARKYVVASYTPGLQYNSDGSISIHMSTERPNGVPLANWLPIPEGPFNIMLRIYGPEGSAAAETYVPPAIRRR